MMVNIFPPLFVSMFDWFLRLFQCFLWAVKYVFLCPQIAKSLCNNNQNFGVRQQRSTQVPGESSCSQNLIVEKKSDPPESQTISFLRSEGIVGPLPWLRAWGLEISIY